MAGCLVESFSEPFGHWAFHLLACLSVDMLPAGDVEVELLHDLVVTLNGPEDNPARLPLPGKILASEV